MSKSFEEIKSEYLRINAEIIEFEKKNFGNLDFDEARLLIEIKIRLEDEIIDKLRLLNDLRNLNKINLESEGTK